MITIIHNLLFNTFDIENYMNQQANPVVPTVIFILFIILHYLVY